MLVELDQTTWNNRISQIRPLSMEEEDGFVKSLCRVFDLKARYFVFEQKGSIRLSFLALCKGKAIVQPIHFYYSAFWIAPELSQLHSMNFCTEFIGQLKKHFSCIDLRLPPQYSDIRPYLWNGFSVTNNYTYIKDLTRLNYSSSVQRNIKQAQKLALSLRCERLNEASEQLNADVFDALGTVPQKRKAQIAALMRALDEQGLLRCFNCYADTELLASQQVFLDFVNKKAYLVLLSRQTKQHGQNVHALLHHFLFEHLQSLGYLRLDLMGGDLRGIADFKTSLKADLQPHFTLKYRSSVANMAKMKQKLVDSLKKIVVRIGMA